MAISDWLNLPDGSKSRSVFQKNASTSFIGLTPNFQEYRFETTIHLILFSLPNISKSSYPFLQSKQFTSTTTQGGSAVDYTEKMKLALNYAEESSKRTRWIVFILQLAVVLVVATIWQENQYNWITLRLQAAQNLVKLLVCHPELQYKNLNQVKTVPISPKYVESAPQSPLSSEFIDTQYRCTDVQRQDEIDQALAYERDWGFSLIEAKKNVNDLQQVMFTRTLGVTFPILGITFDVNDLGLLSGLTFVILLSWFHFALHRQYKNVNHVFRFAREGDNLERTDAEKNADPKKEDAERLARLKIAYRLLAMSQVLTMPPTGSQDLGAPRIRRLFRPSSLAMGTALITQLVMIVNDLNTIVRGEVLSKPVTRIETALAFLLLVYLCYRTYECFKLVGKTDQLWEDAFREWNSGSTEP